MSRHRNVRCMNYDEEYDGYDDVYGRSVEEDPYCVSPSTAQFMYDRNAQSQAMAAYLPKDNIPEEEEDSGDEDTVRRDSFENWYPELNALDEARLKSCLDEIHNIVGDTVPEKALIDAIIINDFHLEKALDCVLQSVSSSSTVGNVKEPQHQQVKKKDDLSSLMSVNFGSECAKHEAAVSGKNELKSSSDATFGGKSLCFIRPPTMKSTERSTQNKMLTTSLLLGHLNQLKGGIQASGNDCTRSSSFVKSLGSNAKGPNHVLPDLKSGVSLLAKLADKHLSETNKLKEFQSGDRSSQDDCVQNLSGGNVNRNASSRMSSASCSSGSNLSPLEMLAKKHLDGSKNQKSSLVQFGFNNLLKTFAKTDFLNDDVAITSPQFVDGFARNFASVDLASKVTETENELVILDLNAALKNNQNMPCATNHSLPEKERNCPKEKAAARDLPDVLHSDLMLRDIGGMMTNPSLFARVLCLRLMTPQMMTPQNSRPSTPIELKNAGRGKRKIVRFDFTTPSPDAIIRKLRSKGFGSSRPTQQRDGAIRKTSKTVGSANESAGHRDEDVDSTGVQLARLVLPPDVPVAVNGGGKAANANEVMKSKRESPEKSLDISKLATFDQSGSNLKDLTPNKLASKIRETGPRIDVEAEYVKERGGTKELLNLVVIGHVDAGKSTLMGHVLWLVGAVNKKLMHKYEQESKKIGKSSFMYAWVLDETGEERSRGVTMDIGYSKFETPSKSITLLDAPGHKDFVPNMITGAAQADVAILVVDATRGEFETGFDSGGQTREHALLVRSLGVSQLLVAINKLDTVSWSQERYNDIVQKLGAFLKQAGFKEAEITYVPCSGLTGENLVDVAQEENLKKWYSGPTLLQQIDKFRCPERPISKPFRLCVSDVFKSLGSSFSVAGKVETGYVQNMDKVLMMPMNEIAVIKSISVDEVVQTKAFAGDQVVVSLGNVDVANVTVGCILCDVSQPVKVGTRFLARIVVFNYEFPITKGFQAILHYQTMSEPVVVKKLVSQLHKSTGEAIKKKPRCLTKHSNAIVELEVSRPICVELYKDIKELGRFMLRTSGTTIAAGLINEILS